MSATVTLGIRSVADATAVEWSIDDQPAGPAFHLDGDAAGLLKGMDAALTELFEQRNRRPFTPPDRLRAAGQTLHRLFFAPVWNTLTARLDGGPHTLLIRSPDRTMLNLPWELVEPGRCATALEQCDPCATALEQCAPCATALEQCDSPSASPMSLPLGCDPAWSLLRTPLTGSLPAAGALPPGPLRILFLAAAPTDVPQLDYEREEDAMLAATARVPGEAIIRFVESGGFDELAEMVTRFHPHVVHLSGHGAVLPDGRGTFAFEDERGHADPRDAADLAARVFRGSSVRCVFLNGCQTSRADVAGLCQMLVTAGLPLAVGWAASVADDLATDFAAEFYERLVSAEPVAQAAAHARLAIRDKGRIQASGVEIQDATYALPQVYASQTTAEVFDRHAAPQRDAGPTTEHVLLGDGVKGLREGFVGRRRQLQRLVPALRDGQTCVAVITGLGGAGKSTLATRIANRLVPAGFEVHAVRVKSADSPQRAGAQTVQELLGLFDRVFSDEAGLKVALADGGISTVRRLELAVDALKKRRLLLVLDNFEDALDLAGRCIVDPELEAFYRYATAHLTSGSRLVVTCRYLPANTPLKPPGVVHEPLPDFQPHDFSKFLRREPQLYQRMSQGEFPAALLAKLYRAFGATPGFLTGIRELLKVIDPVVLAAELDGATTGQIGEKAGEYYERIVVPRLYGALTLDARRVLRRLAVSELPLPMDAMPNIADLAVAKARAALDAAVAWGMLQVFTESDLPTLYHPPGLLRPWLTDPVRLGSDEARRVHAALALFWKVHFGPERVAELRVPLSFQLQACLLHAERGADANTRNWAARRLAKTLEWRSEWAAAREILDKIPAGQRDGAVWYQMGSMDLNAGQYARARQSFGDALAIQQAVGDWAGEAATWHSLAVIDTKEGRYSAARTKLEGTLTLLQASRDLPGEAATWHRLANIDLEEGRYAGARKKLWTALGMHQIIGDRAAEAAAWHKLANIDLAEARHAAAQEKLGRALALVRAIGGQLVRRHELGDRVGQASIFHQLGTLAHQIGLGDSAVRLLALCWVIQKIIGHADANNHFQIMAGVAESLGYDQKALETAVDEAMAAYNRDGGLGFIESMFQNAPVSAARARLFQPPLATVAAAPRDAPDSTTVSRPKRTKRRSWLGRWLGR